MYILALADDMTGALEVGAKFSASGIRTLVSTRPVPADSATAVVFDTETRHLPSMQASSKVKRFLLESGATHPSLIYKKIDSTLRGNIASELQALAQCYPDWSIGYAPAYPALGRTVKGGILYVDGVAVADTEFGQDALNPIRTSSVSAMLDPDLPCTIFDGDSEIHLAEAALAILGDSCMRIAAGPAALAEMLACKIDLPRSEAPHLPLVRTCLVINGSRHERSIKQMRQAEAQGWRALHTNHHPNADPRSIADENSRYTVERIAAEEPDAVLVIGGDTAFAVVQTLGLPPLLPIAEVVPGVPVTRIQAEHLLTVLPRRRRDLYLITKAGGFGEPDVLGRIRSKLGDAR